MIVCDNCKNIDAIAFSCFVALVKMEEKSKRDTEREVKRFPMDLCEECITAMIPIIGNVVTSIKRSK